MPPLKTLIVDDEEEAREGLRHLLQKASDIDLVAVCKNGLEAIQKINQLQPELVFLDIQMPEINGFEVLNNLENTPVPAVIFVTAYDQYALKAFELHALDYLLKPFTDERFYQALAHAKQYLQTASLNQLHEKLSSVLAVYNNQTNETEKDALLDEDSETVSTIPNRLIIKSMGKIYFVPLSDIHWVEAFDYYVKIHLTDKFYLVRTSLKSLEKKLPNHLFLRVHKSQIVNIQSIIELEPYFNGEYLLKLRGDQKLKVSRSYRQGILDLLNG
jgi:two-component system, LytTR family, response regulator